MEERTKPITVKLDDNTTIQFEISIPRREQNISEGKQCKNY